MENSENTGHSNQYRHVLATKKKEYEDLSNNDPKTGTGGSSSGSRGGAQGWRNVRAVMAYYCTLRKIKRNGFLQYTHKQTFFFEMNL